MPRFASGSTAGGVHGGREAPTSADRSFLWAALGRFVIEVSIEVVQGSGILDGPKRTPEVTLAFSAFQPRG